MDRPLRIRDVLDCLAGHGDVERGPTTLDPLDVLDLERHVRPRRVFEGVLDGYSAEVGPCHVGGAGVREPCRELARATADLENGLAGQRWQMIAHHLCPR